MSLLLPALVIVVVVGLAAVVFGGFGVGSWTGRRRAGSDELADAAAPTLDYAVPAGQDPAVVLTALSREGYDAAPDPGHPQVLHVSCPAGLDRDRARVRATIASVHTTAIDAGVPMDPGQVRFLDEQ